MRSDGFGLNGASRHRFKVERDVIYSPPGWPASLTADLYIPDGPGPFPAVLTVHGGSWARRDRRDMAPVARKLARRGFVVANISYRFVPAHVYPAQLEDVRAAIRWLRRRAAQLRVDPARIGGWGYSAGAHLVALAATDIDGPESRLRAVVAGGMPADLPRYPRSPLVTAFIGATYAQAADTWAKASPARQVTRDTPPMFIYHGKRDTLVYVDDAIAMKAALDRAGVRAELYLIPGAGHIATYLFGFGAERAGIHFLNRMLRSADMGSAPAQE